MTPTRRHLTLAATPLLEIGLILAWSSGFIGGTMASATGAVFAVLFWRFLAVGLMLAPWTLGSVMRLPVRALLMQTLIGALAMFVYLAGVTKAIDLGVPAGLAALITALQPMATAALAGIVLGESVTRRQWLGLGIGFAGVALAVGGGLGSAPFHAYGLALASMAAITAATLIAKRRSDALPLVPTLGWQSLVSAALFLPLALMEGSAMPRFDPAFVQAVAWYVLFSTIGAYGLYWTCLARSSATRVSSLIYMTPPTTALWAYLMFGEALTMAAAAGFVVCLAGILIAGRKPGAGAAGTPGTDRPARSPA